MADSFADRVLAVIADRGSLCVGIDPHASLLERWGLPDDASGLRELALRVVDAAAAAGAGAVKPQVAFFERHGSAGFAVLEDVLAAARAAGLLAIADAKRGDVDTTVAAYGEAWLRPGSPLEADAMTAVATQGLGTLGGVFARAREHGKGVFVVTAASNPEAPPMQQARLADGRTVAEAILEGVRAEGGTGGVVIGATTGIRGAGLDERALEGVPVLAPGFGAQGGRLADLPALFGAVAHQVLASVSRSILDAGPDEISAAIRAAREELAG